MPESDSHTDSRDTAKVTGYQLPDGRFIPESGVSQQPKEIQIELMRSWFLQNYENPAESCPYDSAEGGYQYVYGGPYDAREQLQEEFGGTIGDAVIDEAADELNEITYEWSGSSYDVGAIDELLSAAFSEPFRYEEAFRDSATNIARLLEVRVEPADRQCWLRLLFVNVFTALETYLSDKFISSVLADDALLRKFVETTPKFQKETVSLSHLFATHETIKERVRSYLLDEVWHRFDKVVPMFESTLGIKFPSDMRTLFLALIVRHDCVHRNGKTKDGKERILTEKDVKGLLFETDKLVTWIEANGVQVGSNFQFP